MLHSPLVSACVARARERENACMPGREAQREREGHRERVQFLDFNVLLLLVFLH